MKTTLCVVTILLSVGVWTYGEEKAAPVSRFTLTSPSFREGQPIPAKYTCDGDNVSPPLKWEGAPANTKNFALICDDPDAPSGTWVHWLLYDTDITELPEDISKIDAVGEWIGSPTKKKWFAAQGMNGFGKLGYGGPCPPRGHGLHHYHFRIYALDTDQKFQSRLTRQQLEAAMKGHIIAEAELVGTFAKE